MEMTVKITGMGCGACSAKAEKALNALPGITATVDLQSGTAVIKGEADKSAIADAIQKLGFGIEF